MVNGSDAILQYSNTPCRENKLTHYLAIDYGVHTSISVMTTLYDLISAIQEEVDAEEEELVSKTVSDLIDSGKIRFSGRILKTENPASLTPSSNLWQEDPAAPTP